MSDDGVFAVILALACFAAIAAILKHPISFLLLMGIFIYALGRI
jgi:hypothetical protein